MGEQPRHAVRWPDLECSPIKRKKKNGTTTQAVKAPLSYHFPFSAHLHRSTMKCPLDFPDAMAASLATR